MDWLVFLFALELGFARENTTITQYNLGSIQQATYESAWSPYVEFMGGTQIFGLLYLTGTIQTYAVLGNFPTLGPFRADYSIDAYLRWKSFFFGYAHICTHIIESPETCRHDELLSNSDRFYIRFEHNPP